MKCVASASAILRDGANEDTRDFLEAVDAVVTIEHQGDDVQREFLTQLVNAALDSRELHFLNALSEAIESSLDAMSHTALAFHRHLLETRGARR